MSDARHPHIADVKRLAQRDRLPWAVLLFETEDGELGYASYGEDRATCRQAQRLADKLYDHVVDYAPVGEGQR